MSRQSCSKQKISAQAFGCMCVGFLPRRTWCHQSIAQWCGGDVLMMWVVTYDISIKRIKKGESTTEGVLSSKCLKRRGYISQYTTDTSVHPHSRFAKNTQQRGIPCLVYCFLWWCTINQSSFSFYDFHLLWHPSRDCSHPKKIGVPDSKDHWALLVPTEDCNSWSGCSQSFVQLWHIYISIGICMYVCTLCYILLITYIMLHLHYYIILI